MKRALWIAGMLTTTSCVGMDADLSGDIGRSSQKQIMLNQLSNEQLALNALTGTQEALTAVVSQSLSTFGTDPLLSQQLKDPNAQVFMKYLVSCALDESQTVQWTNPDNAMDTRAWTGAHGLCTDWGTQAPSVACQEIVSACLLGRNNAVGKRVTLSTRGVRADGTAIELADVVPAGTHVEFSVDAAGEQVTSFQACGGNVWGAARDCGWPQELALAGECKAGASVTVNAGTQPPGACGGAVLRACADISGCNHATKLAEAEAACGQAAPKVAFTCPEKGVFAVMAAPYESADAWDDAALTATGSGMLPVSELELFGIREGAFYGNLFNPAARSFEASVWVNAKGQVQYQPPRSGSVVIFQDMWACHDPDWTYPDAVMENRLCVTTGSGQLCAATVVGACDEVLAIDPVVLRCDSDDGPPVAGDGDYSNCRDGGGNIRTRPLTVFLKHACDMFSSASLPDCQRI